MATLLIKSGHGEPKPVELKLGVNRIGRHPNNDLHLDDPTVSASHCEIVLAAGSLIVRDRGSTNGTFVDGERVTEATVQAGQTLRFGDVELFVEATEVIIAIPEVPRLAPPPKSNLPEGVLACINHSQTPATYKCKQCQKTFCVVCVHVLRRSGGKPWRFCPACSGQCELLEVKPRKKTLFARLRDTLKLPFRRAGHSDKVR